MGKPLDLRSTSLLAVAYARTGSMLRAARVIAFVMAWGDVRRALGREPTVEEYAAHWREHVATAYRHQHEFREVFDRCHTPAPVLDALESSGTVEHLDVSSLVAA